MILERMQEMARKIGTSEAELIHTQIQVKIMRDRSDLSPTVALMLEDIDVRITALRKLNNF